VRDGEVVRDLGKEGGRTEERPLTRSAVTAERMVAKMASSENSRRTISNPKKRPVRGALNVAAIPRRLRRRR